MSITNALDGFELRDWIVTSYLLTYTGNVMRSLTLVDTGRYVALTPTHRIPRGIRQVRGCIRPQVYVSRGPGLIYSLLDPVWCYEWRCGTVGLSTLTCDGRSSHEANGGEQHYLSCLSRHGSLWHILHDYGYNANFGPPREIWEISCDSSLRFCYCQYSRTHPWGGYQHQLSVEMDLSIEVSEGLCSL